MNRGIFLYGYEHATEMQLKTYPFLRNKSSTQNRYHIPTACLPLHVHQFTLRIPMFLFFFYHFQLLAFVNIKLTCFEVLEYAAHRPA
ncbi:unnamed protein product [Heligmosomoides polygyrus]|uniref:Ovule protein n=1 Tax=Heligmosomoides polygyrus TaxID=6339 RepID=A0A183G0A1_HELPZ|nr:unnamed protein product [Heligmosomoides polygyrus]